MAFRGFPPEAIAFYEGLEADNSRSYWQAHRQTYDDAVRGPMQEMLDELAPEFGQFRIFRPNRDVRFSADKSPYKTAIGCASEGEGGTTYYVHLSSSGLLAGSGYYHMASDQLARFREVVADDATGAPCAAIAAKLTKAGYDMTAIDELKTAPRGYPRDHPRIDLLRRKGLVAMRSWPVAKWLGTKAAKDRVGSAWRDAAELNAWLDANVGPSTLPPEDAERF
jgi:uncharacterized protein (TIGR02453 family)